MSNLPALTPQVFSILSALIEDRLGLFFGPDYLDLVAEKLGPRVAERGFESMLDYYYFLRYDPEAENELRAVADLLTVNETYFFRELTPLEVLVGEFVAPLVAAGKRARIWCAACSTGEEPISLASLLDARGLLDQVEIVASDVSSRALAVASRGVYSGRSLRAIASPQSWLIEEGGRHVVSERLRRAVDWRRVNLLDDAAVAELGVFDAIVCRNVLIYFRDETTTRVLGRLHRALMPDGRLLVGVSESLIRLGTAFQCEERGGAFFYRKSS
ncbi:MAG: protein-glutamate O-methyltransferase CheR [Myxococcota bacterium]|nr:protein-glutamate O-methyltransferase CheR [Myxococcota bacterium]